jgi:drug/metabolite transporter (DMT)-like permease
LSAYITLTSAVVALSSIGPFLKAQKNVSGEMKIVWRFQGTAIFLFPFAIREFLISGMPSLTFAQWGTFLAAAASYAVLCVAFAQSINYTTVANATILTNSQSILLIFGKMFVGYPVVFLEAFGVFVAFMGAILSAKESADAEKTDEDALLSLWGDLLGLISSIGGIGYIVLGKSLRSTMPVLLFMILNMTTASILILLFMWSTEQDISFNRHPNHGVWGWMNLQTDRLPLEIATVFVCNVFGTMGYVRAFKYFSSVTIAVRSWILDTTDCCGYAGAALLLIMVSSSFVLVRSLFLL